MDLSKGELFSRFHNKIDFSDIKDYALNKVTKPTSIDLVRGIVAGPNNDYKAVEENQSYYIYHYIKNTMLSMAESTQREILYIEDWITDSLDGMLIINIKKATPNNRQHILLWGCVRLGLDTYPKVGVLRCFDLPGLLIFSNFSIMEANGENFDSSTSFTAYRFISWNFHVKTLVY